MGKQIVSMLHSRFLRYLDEVVNSGSIRRAAEKLNVASSSISRQILELEEHIRAPIFERLPRGLKLTAAGEILITHVRQTLRDHDRVQSRILALQGLSQGTVKIATMRGPANGVLSGLIIEFRKKHPGIQIFVQTSVSDDIIKAVAQADADFGFGYNLRADASMHILDVFNVRLGAVVAPTHPLAARPGVRLSECCDYPIALADRTFSTYEHVKNACMTSKVTLKPALETNSIELMKHLATHDNAITFLNITDVSEQVRMSDLIFIPLLDESIRTHPLALVQRASTSLAPAPALFAESIRCEVARLLDANPAKRPRKS